MVKADSIDPSDFAPADQVAPVPRFSIEQEVPTVEKDQDADNKETSELAQPYFHPAWSGVEKRFRDILEAYDGNNVMQYKALPAVDFKSAVLVQQTVRGEIKAIMEDVKNAVEASEQQPNRPTQPKRSRGK